MSPIMAILDASDLALLQALSADPRRAVTSLADDLGMSRNTVQARMSRLERAGALLSYERAISTTALGYPIDAFISVRLRQPEIPRIRDDIALIPEVVQANGLAGSMDLLVRVACRDTPHLFTTDRRILAIDGVDRTETSLVMDELIPYRVAPLIDLARSER